MKYAHNILLIAGTGRNVGKTLLVCEIISHLSKTTKVTGLKISHHFHPVEEGQIVIANTSNFHIIQESLNTDKDSSRMKHAGAHKVFYIQAKQEYIPDALLTIEADIVDCPVVCESGSMLPYIEPGLFFLVKGDEVPDNKKYLLSFNPRIVTYKNSIASINVNDIHFQDNCFTISSKTYDPI